MGGGGGRARESGVVQRAAAARDGSGRATEKPWHWHYEALLRPRRPLRFFPARPGGRGEAVGPFRTHAHRKEPYTG